MEKEGGGDEAHHWFHPFRHIQKEDDVFHLKGGRHPSSRCSRGRTRKGTEIFIDAMSHEFVVDYNVALAARSQESSNNPVDVDAKAWMKVASNSGRGRMYGYTFGESPSEFSRAPSRSCGSHGIVISDSGDSGSKFVAHQQMISEMGNVVRSTMNSFRGVISKVVMRAVQRVIADQSQASAEAPPLRDEDDEDDD